MQPTRLPDLQIETIMRAVQWLNPCAAAEHLSLSTSTLAKLRVYGGGPRYSKLGRSVRYNLLDLEEWASSKAKLNTSVAAP